MHPRIRPGFTVLVAVLAGALGWSPLGVPSIAHAGPIPHDGVVSENPVNVTPNVESDSAVSKPAVHALAEKNGTIFAGGAFRTVTDASGSTSYQRHNIMGFDAVTGAMRPFAPAVNGTVWAIEPRGKALFLGGEFTSVNGVNRRAVVKVNAATGAVISKFAANIPSGDITEIRMARGRLIVGGSFPGKLRALDPATGKDTGYVSLPIQGKVADNAGAVKVYRFAVSPNERRLVAIGNFTSVNGAERWRAFMLNLKRGAARLNAWSYAPLKRPCLATSIPAYLRDVDFSPDGTYFVMVSSGFIPQSGGVGTDLCDATARFETAVSNPSAPTWINYTGGDTLHSVAVTGAAVYVQGHQRWLDNPYGKDDAGPGAVAREGIGAIHPTQGTALDWNPGKTRAVGGKDLLATASGLWVGSDGQRFNGEYRARIAFCPL